MDTNTNPTVPTTPSPSTPPPTPTPPPASMGPVVALVVLVALIVAGAGAYYYYQGIPAMDITPQNELEVGQEEDAETQALEQTNSSDEMDAIESDLNTTSDTNVEGEVNSLEGSF